jgi:hypothetical protein
MTGLHGMLPLQYSFKPIDPLGVTMSDVVFLSEELGIEWTLGTEPLPAWFLDTDESFLRACGVIPDLEPEGVKESQCE